MRRVIVSHVYVEDGRVLSPGVVELYDQRVVNCYPVTDDDLAASEWLGGEIYLSGEELENIPKNLNKAGLISFFKSNTLYPRYAYHIPVGHDADSDRLSSEIVMLEDEED